MTKISNVFPIGLVVNQTNILDKSLLKGNIDFLMVKVDGVDKEYDTKLEEHVQMAQDLDIPCGLMCYVNPALIDKNWPLNDYGRWGKGVADPLFKKYMGLKTSKKNYFVVLHYHESKFYENGNVIDPQWLTKIMNYEAEQFHSHFYGPVKDIAVADRRVVVSASPTTAGYLSDPATGLVSWPSMSVVDGYVKLNVTWEVFRTSLADIDTLAVSMTLTRLFWWFDPYPNHQLPGTGNAGLVAYLGTKENFLKWCAYVPAGTNPAPDPEPDPIPDPVPGGNVDLAATNAKLQAIIDMLDPVSTFFARFH